MVIPKEVKPLRIEIYILFEKSRVFTSYLSICEGLGWVQKEPWSLGYSVEINLLVELSIFDL